MIFFNQVPKGAWDYMPLLTGNPGFKYVVRVLSVLCGVLVFRRAGIGGTSRTDLISESMIIKMTQYRKIKFY